MKKIVLLGGILVSTCVFSQKGKVGINTANPDPSSILDINSQDRKNTNAKHGLLIPRVQLQSSIDQSTITSPAKGLLVYNLGDAGTYPNNVVANNYYFWDGSKWLSMPLKSFVEEAVKPRIFYIEGTGTQTFTQTEMNYTTASSSNNKVVTFSGTPTINVGNIITKNTDNSFTINVTGLYDFSAYVNYNPMNITLDTNVANGNQRAFLNVKIQQSTNNGATWTDTEALSRIGWGKGVAGNLRTANIIAFPIQLNKGDRFRLVIANPFVSSAGNDHGHDGQPYIGTQPNSPISKSIRVQLLDFNL